MKFDRRILSTIIAGIVIIAVIAVILASRSSSSHRSDTSSSSGASTTTTAKANGSTNGSSTTTSTIPPGPFTTPSMPVDVTVSSTKGLSSGSSVTVHASPKSGSQMFGVEARLCRGDVAITSDADFVPTRGGNCIVNPLQPGTDAKVLVAGAPPYSGVDVTFKVGTGTDTFMTQYDGTKSITCDASHPCQIVLKLQYPNGFGFQGVPVTFS